MICNVVATAEPEPLVACLTVAPFKAFETVAFIVKGSSWKHTTSSEIVDKKAKILSLVSSPSSHLYSSILRTLKELIEIVDDSFESLGTVPNPPMVKAILVWSKKSNIMGKINPFQPPLTRRKTNPVIKTKRANGKANPKTAKNGKFVGEITSLIFATTRINIAGSTMK